MTNCNNYVFNGVLSRYIVTIIAYFALFFHKNNTIIQKYLYLLLPILLTVLDKIDSVFKHFHKNKKCLKTFYYQYLDKICDSFSYLLLLLFFQFDNYYLFFALYRCIGVVLFSLTKNSKWLIFFFDFVKEYLLYLFVFGRNYNYMPVFILCKIVFEYYFHTKINKPQY